MDVFGDSSSESEQEEQQGSPSVPQRRPNENGALTFHNGTEAALFLFVQQQQQQKSSGPSTIKTLLKAIDTFCETRHWMMHCGPVKKMIVKEFVRNHPLPHERPLRVLEVGTYCGYSALCWVEILLELKVTDFHILSVDVQSQYVAKQLLELVPDQAKSHVTYCLRQTGESLPELLSRMDYHPFHILFLDHDKSLYLEDLNDLEKTNHIRTDSIVIADNALDNKAYRDHIAALARTGIVRSQLVETTIEYSDLPDGIELTVYEKDPVSTTNT